jgi:2',3'-cyclic-nucleotide 2'-phosphodiesterase (5'-nucleotidase family)
MDAARAVLCTRGARLLVSILLSCLLASLCVHAPIFAHAAPQEIVLVYTGYVHGGITPATSGNLFCITNGRSTAENDADPACLGGCARRQGVIEAVRERYPEAITVDIGGFVWGSLFYNVYGGEPGLECFKRSQYDVAGLGGSDFYSNRESLINLLQSFGDGRKFIGTNFVLGGSETSDLHGLVARSAVHTIPSSGVKVGFVSVLSWRFSTSTSFSKDELVVSEFSREIRTEVGRLNRDGVSVIVLLCTADPERPLSELLQFEHVNIILIARNYATTPVQPFLSKNIYGTDVIIASVGSHFGVDVGFVRATFDGSTLDTASVFNAVGLGTSGTFPFPSGTSVSRLSTTFTYTGITAATPINATTQAYFNDQYQVMSNETFTRTVSVALRPVEFTTGTNMTTAGYGCRSGPCPIGRLVVDAFQSACPDPKRRCISLLNAGALRAGFYPRVAAASEADEPGSATTAASAAVGSAGAGVSVKATYERVRQRARERHAARAQARARAYARAQGRGGLASSSARSLADEDTAFDVLGVDAYLVLPFLNTLGYVQVKGSTIRKILAFSVSTGTNARMLQSNLRVILNPTASTDADPLARVLEVNIPASAGPRPVAVSERDTWVPLVDEDLYWVVTSAYLIEGGDNYTQFLGDAPDTYTDTGRVLSEVFADYLVSQNAAGKPLDYPTMSEERSCVTAEPLAPTPPPTMCQTFFTTYTSADINKCSTDTAFCDAYIGQTLFDSLVVQAAPCDQCSGLGVCDRRVCTCSGSYYLDSEAGPETVLVNVVEGAPTSGPWKGVVLVDGPTCSNIRSVWSLSTGAKAAVIVAAGLAIAFALACLIGVIKFYAHPVMRASTPFLCILICAGGLLAGGGVLTDGLYLNDATCTLTIWGLALGFSLVAGTIFCKLHRIKQIVNASLLQARVSYTELHVLVGTLVLCAANLALLIVFTLHEPARLMPVAFDRSFELGYLCRSDERVYTATFLSLNGAILLAGLLVAFSTRNESANFGECKYLGYTLFNMTFMALVTFLVSFVVTEFDPSVSVILRGWLISYIVISSLALVLGPRFALIYRGVTQVENYQAKSITAASGAEAHKQAARDKRTIQTLTLRIRERDEQIAARDAAIAEAARILADHGVNIPRFELTEVKPAGEIEREANAAAVSVAAGSVLAASGTATNASGNVNGNANAVPAPPASPAAAAAYSGASDHSYVRVPVTPMQSHAPHLGASPPAPLNVADGSFGGTADSVPMGSASTSAGVALMPPAQYGRSSSAHHGATSPAHGAAATPGSATVFTRRPMFGGSATQSRGRGAPPSPLPSQWTPPVAQPAAPLPPTPNETDD